MEDNDGYAHVSLRIKCVECARLFHSGGRKLITDNCNVYITPFMRFFACNGPKKIDSMKMNVFPFSNRLLEALCRIDTVLKDGLFPFYCARSMIF